MLELEFEASATLVPGFRTFRLRGQSRPRWTRRLESPDSAITSPNEALDLFLVLSRQHLAGTRLCYYLPGLLRLIYLWRALEPPEVGRDSSESGSVKAMYSPE